MAHKQWPHARLRDALGWGMAAIGMLTPGPTPLDNEVALADRIEALIRDWHLGGFTPDRWLFAAAGLTPAEARAGLADRSLTVEGVEALVALRGTPVPHGALGAHGAR